MCQLSRFSVLRNGEITELQPADIVVGDIVQFKYGNTFPCDGLLINVRYHGDEPLCTSYLCSHGYRALMFQSTRALLLGSHCWSRSHQNWTLSYWRGPR